MLLTGEIYHDLGAEFYDERIDPPDASTATSPNSKPPATPSPSPPSPSNHDALGATPEPAAAPHPNTINSFHPRTRRGGVADVELVGAYSRGMVRVGVSGAGGRMGRSVCAAVLADPELELVAAVDPHAAGQMVEGVTIAAEPKAFVEAGCEVVVDFSVAAAARTTVPFLAMHGIHAVVGTTGLTDDDLDRAR